MKIGILISGRGSNMFALVEAVNTGEIPNSEITVVISDKPEAAGLQKAREKGVEAIVIERGKRTRREHDAETIAELKKRGVELICLAGYMRLLSAEFIEAFRNKIINIHPSLLPSFPGLDAQQQAFDYGVKYSGCTIHFVDEGLDSGAIIAQKVVPVSDDDTPETLAARILEQEHRLYPEAVAKIVLGKYEIKGRRVIFDRKVSKDL